MTQSSSHSVGVPFPNTFRGMGFDIRTIKAAINETHQIRLSKGGAKSYTQEFGPGYHNRHQHRCQDLPGTPVPARAYQAR